jgi:probable HAF family extracellular repeat protein
MRRNKNVKNRVFTILVLFALLMGLAVSPVSAAKSSTYTIIDLGAGAAYDINDHGQVVGQSGDHAFVWEDGVMIDLGTLGGTYSIAYAINRSGQVVSSSTTASGEYHAVLWTP